MPVDDALEFNCNAFDLAHQRVRLSIGISVWPDWEEGRRIYRLEHDSSGRFFDVGPREYAFISLLDGKTTVSAACGIAASHLADEALSQQEAVQIVRLLLQEGLAELVASTGRGLVRNSAGRQHPAGSDHRRGLVQRLNPFWIQMPLVKKADRLYPVLRHLSSMIRPGFGVLALLLISVGVVTFAINYESVLASGDNWLSLDRWIGLLLTWCILKVIHEVGHAAMCVRLGGRVGEIGIVFVLLAPLAYVDVSSSWRLSSWKRILISSAGMLVELAIASVAMMLWLLADEPQARFWLSNIIVVAGVSTILFNANPLMRFDGYYILSDLVGIPNLAGEGSQALSRMMRRVCYGETSTVAPRRGARRWFVIGYGCAAAVWKVFIVLGLSIAAAVMMSGAGIVIAMAGLAACLSRPIKTTLSGLARRLRTEPMKCVRAVAVLLLAMTGIVFGVSLPIPTGVPVAAIVEDPAGSIVRVDSDGFIRELFVEDGQRIRKGDRLMRLENRDLSEQLSQLQIGLKENEVLARMAAESHDPADDRTTEEDRKALLAKIAKLKPQVDSLTLLAPKSGTVRRRELDAFLGRFVRAGDEVLRVVDDTAPEVVGMIHQDEINAARRRVGDVIYVYDACHRAYPAVLKLVEPRAVYDLQSAALAAPFGGPLSVVESRDHGRFDEEAEEYRLTDPHFIARAELTGDKALALKSGMRVTMRVGPARRSLATRVELRLRAWWMESYEDANRSMY